MNKQFIDYEEWLFDSLQDFAEAAALLDEDPRVFLLALRQVFAAQGHRMAEVVHKTHLSRENLYRMLSKKR